MLNKKIFWKNLHFLKTVLGVILIWRGLWFILDTYLFPERPLLSALISIAFGIVILLHKDHLLNELGR